MPRRITAIYIHHTAGPRTQTRDQIDADHRNNRGWSAIGYHWTLRYAQDGGPVELDVGRPESQRGAHVQGHNTASIGIAVIWNVEVSPLPTPLYRALVAHVAATAARYGLTAEDVRGHKEAPYATACPGAHLDLGQLRTDVARRLRAAA